MTTPIEGPLDLIASTQFSVSSILSIIVIVGTHCPDSACRSLLYSFLPNVQFCRCLRLCYYVVWRSYSEELHIKHVTDKMNIEFIWPTINTTRHNLSHFNWICIPLFLISSFLDCAYISIHTSTSLNQRPYVHIIHVPCSARSKVFLHSVFYRDVNIAAKFNLFGLSAGRDL